MAIHDEHATVSPAPIGVDPDTGETFDRVAYHFASDTSRRDFLQLLGAGLVISVATETALAQPPGGRRRGGGGGGGGGGFFGRGATSLAARLHIGSDGTITVMTGKVEGGQGSRAELTQAAAEELGVAAAQVHLLMADTSLVPDDGGSAGSQTTPRSVPAIRQGCAAARQLLAATAAKRWGVDAATVEVRDGKAVDKTSGRSFSYTELGADADAAKSIAAAIPATVSLMPVASWKVMGTTLPRPNGHAIVTGTHHYPSDIDRKGLLFGKVLRRPSFGATLTAIDLDAARKFEGVVVVSDNDFVGVVARTSYLARKALAALAATARWSTAPHPSSEQLYDHLRRHARGGVPRNPAADVVAKASKSLRQAYHVAYVQHCPMETRAAVAEWEGGKLTVWTSTQMPFGVRGELAGAFGLEPEQVRLIVPDFGCGFGGKHSGECAVEAARLAKAAGKPVRLQWTRPEEFTWAQFRPAAVIDIEASLDDAGGMTSFHQVNINAGPSAVQSPYRAGRNQGTFVGSEAPLRQGSYRALAATANTFARECFIDELAATAGRDPLEFRLAHLEPGRLRNVLEEAARRFGWAERSKRKAADIGVGLACSTEKGSFVAACVEVVVDRAAGTIAVKQVCQAFECGKIINPANLLSQVRGAIIMGIGPALREEVRFEGGKVLTTSFGSYRVPRISDVPELDIHLIDRPDLPSVGAGETPLVALAPAIANAVHAATGVRVRTMPIRLPGSRAEA